MSDFLLELRDGMGGYRDQAADKIEGLKAYITILEAKDTMTNHLKTDWDKEKKRMFLEGFKVSNGIFNASMWDDYTDEELFEEKLRKHYKDISND